MGWILISMGRLVMAKQVLVSQLLCPNVSGPCGTLFTVGGYSHEIVDGYNLLILREEESKSMPILECYCRDLGMGNEEPTVTIPQL